MLKYKLEENYVMNKSEEKNIGKNLKKKYNVSGAYGGTYNAAHAIIFFF